MDKYLTGATIKELREKRGMTQAQLADILSVSDKAVSKWETGAGYPDITLIEPIAAALRVSVAELLAGAAVGLTVPLFVFTFLLVKNADAGKPAEPPSPEKGSDRHG